MCSGVLQVSFDRDTFELGRTSSRRESLALWCDKAVAHRVANRFVHGIRDVKLSPAFSDGSRRHAGKLRWRHALLMGASASFPQYPGCSLPLTEVSLARDVASLAVPAG